MTFIGSAKRALKTALPASVLSRWKTLRIDAMVGKEDHANLQRSAGEVFDEIYQKNKWGGDARQAFSGTGSIGEPVQDYISVINEFIAANRIASVLDIGCGDFRVGSQLSCEKYIGIDVASTVVRNNIERFGSRSREFICLDAAGPDPLPVADLCLVRQVFQHLSNAQISAILTKLAAYQFVIVTEHQPSDEDYVSANTDKIHGPFTRLFSGSGVYLDRPPFNLTLRLLLEASSPSTVADDVHARGTIRTFLVR